MKKVTGTQLLLGGLLLYLIFRPRAKQTTAPVKTAPTPQPYTSATKTTGQQPAGSIAGSWEIDCYHQVI